MNMTRLIYTQFLTLVLLAGANAAAQPAAGPLRVHPENPRYFTDDSGRAILLTGSHTWNNLVDMGPTDPPAAFDYDAYLDCLAKRHHNFFRLWTWELLTWDTRGNREKKALKHYVTPQPWKRTGPGQALDGKPKFDLEQFNDEYFTRLRDRVRAAQDRGLYPAVMLFEGWGMQFSPDAWKNHPFHPDNNINGVNGDLDGDGMGLEIHAGKSPKVTELQQAYVRKVIDTVNPFDNVLYEISNENHPPSAEWQYAMIRFIKQCELGLPKQHPVGMPFQYKGGSNQTLFDSPADGISPNPDGGYRDDPPAADGRKVIVSDTDPLWGIGGNVARNNHNHGLWIDYGGTDCVIENNFVYNAVAGAVLNEVTPNPEQSQFADGTRGEQKEPDAETVRRFQQQGTIIRNNVLVGTRAPGGGGINISSSSDGRICNNVVTAHVGGGLNYGGSPDREHTAGQARNRCFGNLCYDNCQHATVLRQEDDRHGRTFDNLMESNLFVAARNDPPLRLGGQGVTPDEFESYNTGRANVLFDGPLFRDPEHFDFTLVDQEPASRVGFDPAVMRLDWSEYFVAPMDMESNSVRTNLQFTPIPLTLSEEPIPKGLDWNLWTGLAALHPYNRQLQERMEGYQGWAQWWDYSGGDVTLHGAHAADQIQYTLGKDDTGPVEIWPNSEGLDAEVTMKYADGTIVRFEREEGVLWGAVFIGDKGKIEINRGRVAGNPAELVAQAPASSGGNAEPHLQNWLDCIKTRERPIADVEAGHRAVNLCHLVNICRELGRKIHWDPNREQFVNDPAANALLDRPRRRGFELPVV